MTWYEYPRRVLEWKLRLLTFNVDTLNGAGKASLLQTQVGLHDVDVCGVQETRLHGEGSRCIAEWVVLATAAVDKVGGIQFWAQAWIISIARGGRENR